MYQESSLRYSKSATLVLLLSSSSLTSVALIQKARKSPVSMAIEAAMPCQCLQRISGLLWHIIIKQWALSWRGWTQINYLFLYSGDGYLLKRCLCHSSQLQGWDELHTTSSAAGMMLLLHLQLCALLQKRDELKSACYSINHSAVRGHASTKCEGKYWVLPRTAQNVRESIEYFPEQLHQLGKSTPVLTKLL